MCSRVCECQKTTPHSLDFDKDIGSHLEDFLSSFLPFFHHTSPFSPSPFPFPFPPSSSGIPLISAPASHGSSGHAPEAKVWPLSQRVCDLLRRPDAELNHERQSCGHTTGPLLHSEPPTASSGSRSQAILLCWGSSFG